MQSANRGPHDPAAYDLRSRKRARWDEFAANLEVAVNASMPTYTKPFSRVAVIFITWENDDLNLEPLNNRLKTVFQKSYNFACESFAIPHNSNAEDTLIARLRKFRGDWDAADNLTIYFYGGHAEDLDVTRVPPAWVWYGAKHARYTVDWFGRRGIHGIPGDSKGKVLLIFDTCYSGLGAVYRGPEILAASPWDTQAPGAHQNSFTWHLADELHQLNGSPQTVAQITSNITRNCLHTNLQSMPVHVSSPGEPSIILARLSEKPTKRSDLGRQRPKLESEFRVLVAVRVEDTVNPPALANWRNWLTSNMPSGLLSTQVSVEGAFDGNSSILLLTLPHEIWSCLDQSDDSIRFISHVRSKNHLFTRRGLQVMGLAPPQGGQPSKQPPPPGPSGGLPLIGGRENVPLTGGKENTRRTDGQENTRQTGGQEGLPRTGGRADLPR